MQKKQVGLRIEAHLKDGLDDQARRTGIPATTLLENYIAKGLARDSGELVEQNSLPAVRQAVKEEVAKAIQELYHHLSTDLHKSARRSDDRLIALIVKGVRSSSITQRMLFTFIGKIVDSTYAKHTFEEAKELAGKDMARPTNES